MAKRKGSMNIPFFFLSCYSNNINNHIGEGTALLMLLQHMETLEKELETLKENYLTHEKPENRRDPEFFAYVKKQTEPIFDIINQWYEEALTFVKNREVSVHPQQVQSTEENLHLILLNSYYIDVRRKRYMELHKSILYVFDLLKKDMEK